MTKTIGRTPRQPLLGYSPRGGIDALVKDDIAVVPSLIGDILKDRKRAVEKIKLEQTKQKGYYDLRRRTPKKYAKRDLVLVSFPVFTHK